MKQNCEVKFYVACNNQCVKRMTGPKKGDPVFWCCIGCFAYANRQGARFKDAPTPKRRARKTQEAN